MNRLVIISALAFFLCGAMYAAENTASILLTITESSGDETDDIVLLENEAYSEAFVQGEDSKKMDMTDESTVYIYTMVGTEACANKGTNNLYGTELIVKTNSTSRFTFSVDYQAGSKLYYLYDVDSVKLTPLLTTSTYTCDIPANQTVAERFYILDLSEHPRAIANGNWGTVCLPYKIAISEGANLYEFAGINAAKTQVYVDPVDVKDVVAGKAYLFNATGDAGQVFKYAALKPVAAPVSNNGLVGVFADSTTVAQAWVIKGQQVIPAAVGSSVPQYRAFVPSLDDIPDIQNAPVRAGRLIFNVKSGTTELENVNANVNANGKMMLDGKLVIIRDGKMFNAQGQEL